MTSSSTIGAAAPPNLVRTLRDVIAHQGELVNEVWCRKVFRHILLALERSHTLRLPHAPVSPDTIGFDAVGDAILLPSTQGAAEPGEAADVQALGAVIHQAITGEATPLAPLRGRAPGYSESLVGAVDKCIASDPAKRPQSIAELRDLLGIVALGPAVQSAAPSAAPPMLLQPHHGGIAWLGTWQRWLLIGLACIVLLAAAAALVVLLRGAGADDNIVLTLPESIPPAKTLDPHESLVRPPTHAALPAQAGVPARATAGSATLPAPAAPHNSGSAPLHAVPAAAPKPAEPVPSRAAPAPERTAQQSAGTTYKLMIKPWGTVYVDGIERGVSPPLKKLSLPAGPHTVRIVNPHYRDRVLRLESGKRAAGSIGIDFSAPSR